MGKKNFPNESYMTHLRDIINYDNLVITVVWRSTTMKDRREIKGSILEERSKQLCQGVIVCKRQSPLLGSRCTVRLFEPIIETATFHLNLIWMWLRWKWLLYATWHYAPFAITTPIFRYNAACLQNNLLLCIWTYYIILYNNLAF